MTEIHEEVRKAYASAALAVLNPQLDPHPGTEAVGPCCGDGCCAPGPASGQSAEGSTEPVFGAELYSALERASIPDAAALASLGCGNPTAVADLREGERVLDLGSGGGIDVLLSAKRVGVTGKAYGLDMTDEMLALALRTASEAGATNVEFLRGQIEAIPLPADTIDVVISNCVINLAADKEAVFREMARVLRPGGRIGVTDIVASDALTPAQRGERGSHVGCVAGALSFTEYERGLRNAGFEDVRLVPTHSVADQMFSAIVRARMPAAVPAAADVS